MRTIDTRSPYRVPPRCTVVVLLALLLLPTMAYAQTPSFVEAQSTYNDGAYEEAAALFKTLASDDSLEIEIRRDALRYLSRAYIAQNMMEDARNAVADLLGLEPPLVELDPDVEPPSLMNLYYETRQQATGHQVPRQDPGMKTLAVMDFRNYVFDDKERWDMMQWGFSSMMIEQLSGATDLKLVERENLRYLLDELDIQQSGYVDQATAVRMGKLLGAHAMIFGGIIVSGRRMTLSARVVKVETGEVLLGESVGGRASDFYTVIEKLSLAVARSLNSTLTETEIGARTETKSLDAMQAYSAGLKLAEDGYYREAYEKYMDALEHDPGYTRAERRAQALVPILAAYAQPESTEADSTSGTSGEG